MTADLPDRATGDREWEARRAQQLWDRKRVEEYAAVVGVELTPSEDMMDAVDELYRAALAARPAPDDGEAGMSFDTLSGPRTVPGVHGYPNGTDTRPTVTSKPSVGIRAQTVTPTEEA